jgi:hypothetical protein
MNDRGRADIGGDDYNAWNAPPEEILELTEEILTSIGAILNESLPTSSIGWLRGFHNRNKCPHEDKFESDFCIFEIFQLLYLRSP